MHVFLMLSFVLKKTLVDWFLNVILEDVYGFGQNLLIKSLKSSEGVFN